MTTVELKEGILMALSALIGHKFRSSLTILGVLIGVWSVIGMTSLIIGLDSAVQSSINELGNNILFIDRFSPEVDYDELTEDERNRKFMTIVEAEAIKASCPTVAAVSPENHYWAPGGNIIKYKGKKANRPAIVGVWPEYQRVHNIVLTSGRFITKLDNDIRANNCILGSTVKDALFPNEDPIGKEIRLNNIRFTVVGVREKQDNLFGSDENNKVAIPLETFMKLYPSDEALTLVASAVAPDKIEEAREEIIIALRKVRNVPYNQENDFVVFGQEQLREIYGNISKYVYIAMIVISSIGLMVGGVGVMNIMLVSVTERTREIGVRKAIGAKRLNILWQFLIEAMTLSGTGGILGIIFGILTALLIKMITPLPFGVSPFYVSLGFLVAVSVGLVAGLYPAYRAAVLDPIESLRYE
ncbi:MAG: ABC transporter permease [Candidatus Zixiibacteriota bacterium]